MNKRFLLAFAATLALSANVFAADINITANGVPVKTTAAPISKDGSTLVPIRAVSEALGSDVAWDADKKTATIKNEGLEIILTLDNKTAQVNGKDVEMPVAATLVNGSVMVPVRFVAENLKSYVKWTQGEGVSPSVVSIYSEYPTKTESGIGISSYWKSEVTKLSDTETFTYEEIVPQFSGFPDASKQDSLNKTEAAKVDAGFEDSKKSVEETLDAVDGDISFSMEVRANYDFLGVDSGLLQIKDYGESYFGGAHANPYEDYRLYDINTLNVLEFKDLFTSSAIENDELKTPILSAVDNALKKEDYADVTNPFADGWSLDAVSDFYIKDGNLVLVYAPYVIAPFSAGFVEFPIPIGDLQGVLAEPYKNLKF
ncbi:hypothetical protein AGMMS49975_04740 [Clostridia bacterium]|nr:hypothetical protein AGMMS49975_04740 [Clostridia bacterium]